jgi:hypothetical protein
MALITRQQKLLDHHGRQEQKQQNKDRTHFIMHTKIGPYDGSENPKDLQAFITDIKTTADAYDLNEAQYIKFAGNNMTGKAKTWFHQYQRDNLLEKENFTSKEEPEEDTESQQNEEDSETFEIFVKKLQDHFTRDFDYLQAAEKFMRLTQTGSVADFNHQFHHALEYASEDPLPEKQKLFHYTRKLKRYIRLEVRAKSPKTLKEAIKLALLFERSNDDDNFTNGYRHQDKTKFGKSRQNNYIQAKTNPDTQLCFNCNGKNHKAEHCTAPRSKK